MKEAMPIYIVAEMACSHEGEPRLARKIIDGAGKAGASAIQFQIWALKEMVVPHHPDYSMLSRLEIPREDWDELAMYTRKYYPKMEIIACVSEPGSVDFCEKIGVSAYKLHSSDLSNPKLVRCVTKTGKRIDLSVGASTIDEIHTAVQWIRAASDSEIWLMYGYQNFPTPINAIHLNYMMKLQKLFELPVAYQDHSDASSDAAFWLPAAAVGMGINILEKHITHDRSCKGIDHEAALNPDEFARFVAMVREIEVAKGSSVPRPFSDEELTNRKYSKKSLVSAHDLPTGTILSQNDLLAMRADKLGLPPDQVNRLVGKAIKRDISAYQLIFEDDLA